MTDAGMKTVLNVPAFYDSLAPDYDEMTGFGKRFAHEKPFFRLLVENHRIATALDAGCGTGFHSLLLAQLGVRVTAVDVSEAMLDALERHGKEMDLNVRGVRSDFLLLKDAVAGPFDAVFCMGNTLPHLLTEPDIRTALEGFSSLIAPGGILFLQILNYDRILATGTRIQGAREKNGVTYVRFYDFHDSGGAVLFNILRLEKKEEELMAGLITVPLLPLTSGQITGILEQCHYRQIKMFGSVAMDPFYPSLSKDIVILATPA